MKRKKMAICCLPVLVLMLLTACNSIVEEKTSATLSETEETREEGMPDNIATIPEELEQIPSEYLQEAAQQGSIEELHYNTYEAFSYEDKVQELQKTAYVYLPYGYDEDKEYNVFYLMH